MLLAIAYLKVDIDIICVCRNNINDILTFIFLLLKYRYLPISIGTSIGIPS